MLAAGFVVYWGAKEWRLWAGEREGVFLSSVRDSTI